jgi:hypothetical protein
MGNLYYAAEKRKLHGSCTASAGAASTVKHLQLPLKPDFQSDLCQSWGHIPARFLMFCSQAQHLLKKNNTIVRFLAIFFSLGQTLQIMR